LRRVATYATGNRKAEVGEGLDVQVTESVRAWAVVARGFVDMQTAAQLEAVLGDIIGRGARLVTLDLEGVDFLDSSGLRVIVAASEKLREQEGSLLLEGASPAVLRVLEITDVIERLKHSRPDGS
jgi:anti-sigma B factor antagonist